MNLSETAVIKALNIHKSFGELHVLKGIDISIAQGEIVAIIGKSGAGKSTLLHIMGTLETADSGELFIQGKAIAGMSNKALSAIRNQSIGFVFQFHHLLQEFTALENVCIPGWMKGTPRPKVVKRAKELLDYLGISERLEHKPAEMSGGEQQRVAVARALINNPAVILADEPTGNLDSESSGEIHKLILKLREDFGQSFVIVTHNNDLASLCDRKFAMQDGRILFPPESSPSTQATK